MMIMMKKMIMMIIIMTFLIRNGRESGEAGKISVEIEGHLLLSHKPLSLAPSWGVQGSLTQPKPGERDSRYPLRAGDTVDGGLTAWERNGLMINCLKGCRG